MKYWCLLDWGGTDIRALRRASHGSDIDYNIQLRSMACDKEEEKYNVMIVIVCFQQTQSACLAILVAESIKISCGPYIFSIPI